MLNFMTSLARMSVMPKERRSPTSGDMKQTAMALVERIIVGRMTISLYESVARCRRRSKRTFGHGSEGDES